MGIYKHKNGKYYCRGCVNGERYHISCTGATSIAEAKAIEDGIRFKLRQEQIGLKAKRKEYTIKFMMDKYVSVCKAKNKTYRAAIIYAKYICNYFGERKQISKIKPSDIEVFLYHLINEGRAKATANRYLSAIKRAYNIMYNDDLIDYNPAKKVSKYTEDNLRNRYLSKKEWGKLRVNLPYTVLCIVICALQTGLRKSNVLNLRWEQIDLEQRIITIESSESKNKRRIRKHITDTLYNLLIELEPEESGYVFLNPETNMPYKDIRKTFYKALENSGITNFKFHDLRRTVATWLLEKGVDIRTIQNILDHKDISTTQRYLSLIPEQDIKAIDTLNEFMA